MLIHHNTSLLPFKGTTTQLLLMQGFKNRTEVVSKPKGIDASSGSSQNVTQHDQNATMIKHRLAATASSDSQYSQSIINAFTTQNNSKKQQTNRLDHAVLEYDLTKVVDERFRATQRIKKCLRYAQAQQTTKKEGSMHATKEKAENIKGVIKATQHELSAEKDEVTGTRAQTLTQNALVPSRQHINIHV